MENTSAVPEGIGLEYTEEGFRLTAPLPCPPAEARCLAVVAAVWVRSALGRGRIQWPNHVVVEGERVCAIECRVTAEGSLRFTFRPAEGALTVPLEDFAAAVAAEAAGALAGYPDNQPRLLSAYCEQCDTVMKFVDTAYRGVPLYGFAFAVDRHGGLMVMTQESHTVVTLYGGEAKITGKRDPEMPDLPPMPGT